MRELFSSMMRFSGAVTMFSMEQVQNAIYAPADTQAALTKMRESLDAMSQSLASKMDDSKRAALDSMSKVQTDIVDRTLEMVSMDSAGEFMQKTSASLSNVVSRSAATD
jgi:hypothetical protein